MTGFKIKPLTAKDMPTAKDVKELAMGRPGATSLDLKKKVEKTLIQGLEDNMPLVLEAAIRNATEGGKDGFGNSQMQKFLLERFVGVASSEDKKGKEVPQININISGLSDEKREKVVSSVIDSTVSHEESGS